LDDGRPQTSSIASDLVKERTMKVLFIINTLGGGGAERSLVELVRVAGPEMQSTIVCLQDRDEGLARDALDIGVEVQVVGGTHVDWARGVRRAILEIRPDMIHTTLFEADVIGRIAAIGTGVPVVTSLVNTAYDPVRFTDPGISAPKLRAVRSIDGWTGRHLTTHFHAISHAVRDSAVRDLGVDPARVTVVERGRDPARLGEPSNERRQRSRRSLGVSTDNFVVLTLGRQEFQKGQWHLVHAMPKLLAEDPGVLLLIAGREGSASARLRDEIRGSRVDQHVRLLGYREDVPELLAAADLFVLPSLYEGLGGVLIEAMALGLPIVASDLPAIREVVDDENATLVPPAAPQDLADAIVRLRGDPARRARMGARSREIFQERFTLERSAKRMLTLFQRVASEGRRTA
jgi:glycosyltransferase involved in cell wall biosynthesis